LRRSLVNGLLSALAFALTFCLPHSARAQYAGHVSSFIIDAKTGSVLLESDPNLQRYPASLTKLMTLYLTFKALDAGHISFDSLVPVSIHAASMEPSKLGLRPGMRLTVREAVLGLVTKSANDAAAALGELLGRGDEVYFANIMTREARALGMRDTTFQNASGLPDPEQVTTAHDIALLSARLMHDFPNYYPLFSTKSFVFHGRVIPNHNPMLKGYVGADGLKTGYTALAGHNLAASARRGAVQLIGVVLGARSNLQRNRIMTSLLDKGFEMEGVAPVPAASEAPIVMARAASRHRRVRRNRAGTYRSTTVEVAEAPSGPRRYRLVTHRATKRRVARKPVSVRAASSVRHHTAKISKTKRHHTRHQG